MFRKILLLIIIITGTVISQSAPKDSVYAGRKCVIILFNGFESEGTITEVWPDSIKFKNDFAIYTIQRAQIKALNRWEDAENVIIEEIIADTSKYCDVYLDNGIKMTDVKLVKETDSTVKILKIDRIRTYKIASIRKIVFSNPGFGTGFLYGFGVGAALSISFMFAYPVDKEWTEHLGYKMLFLLAVSVPAGLIGGIIGAITSKEDIYLFEKGFSKVKSKKINYIIDKHRQ